MEHATLRPHATIVRQLSLSGPVSLGRDDVAAEQPPADVSASHVSFSLMDDGSVTCTLTGRAGGMVSRDDDATMLVKDVPVPLRDGDRLTLVKRRYPFIVTLRPAHAAVIDAHADDAAPLLQLVEAAAEPAPRKRARFDIPDPVPTLRFEWTGATLLLPLLSVGDYAFTVNDSLAACAAALAASCSGLRQPLTLVLLLEPADVSELLHDARTGGYDDAVSDATAALACDTALGRLCAHMRAYEDVCDCTQIRTATHANVCITPKPPSHSMTVAVVCGAAHAPLTHAPTREALLRAGCLSVAAAEPRAACVCIGVRSNWRFDVNRLDVCTLRISERACAHLASAVHPRSHMHVIAHSVKAAYSSMGTRSAVFALGLARMPMFEGCPAVLEERLTHALLCVCPTRNPARADTMATQPAEEQAAALTDAYKNVIRACEGAVKQMGADVGAAAAPAHSGADPVPAAREDAAAPSGSAAGNAHTLVAPVAIAASGAAAAASAALPADLAAPELPSPAQIGSAASEPLDVSRVVVSAYDHPAGFESNPHSALRAYTSRPAAYAGMIIYSDDRVVVVPDKYPKALVHVLVIPRPNSRAELVDGPASLHRAHLPLLTHIQRVAAAVQQVLLPHVCGQLRISPAALRVRVGVHSVPSLTPLHVHVISSDMLSPCVKNVKHVRSFDDSIAFLRPLDDVIRELSRETGSGRVHVVADAERLLKGSCPCPRCERACVGFSAWRTHVYGCVAPHLGVNEETVVQHFRARGIVE